jgi:hypothetical protein
MLTRTLVVIFLTVAFNCCESAIESEEALRPYKSGFLLPRSNRLCMTPWETSWRSYDRGQSNVAHT